jgi:hypothetical protein
MATEQEQSLRHLLREALARSREPDPHVVARRVASKLSRETLIGAAIWGLEAMAREQIRITRYAAPGPSRHSIVMRERVAIGDVWMFLDDCGADELLMLASEYRERSEAMLAKAVEYESLADELQRSGCATVGDLWARKDLAA